MQSGFAHYIDYMNRLNEELVRAFAEHGKLRLKVPEPACSHSFVDTGMRKSWCKHCDCEGLFTNGRYEEVTK